MATLYEKVGRRYVPVHDSAAYDGLSNGEWVVTVKDGRRTAHRQIDATEGFQAIAAIPELTDWMAGLLREWSATRPARPLNAREKKAWEAWKAIMGDDATLMLERPAAWDVAHEVARRVAERARDGCVVLDDSKF